MCDACRQPAITVVTISWRTGEQTEYHLCAHCAARFKPYAPSITSITIQNETDYQAQAQNLVAFFCGPAKTTRSTTN